jgi:D-glycero-alpha-D-manno-heptose-7-phosphate kinase
MLIHAAPLRVSFVGGGSDLPSFYEFAGSVGRVISAAINKFVVISVQHTPLWSPVKLKYSETEEVCNIDEIKHTRLSAALRYFDVRSHVEITSMADLPGRIGLGSSSAFTVALVSALAEYTGLNPGSRSAIADLAFRFETDHVGETLGKQDQYASAFGGANIFEFQSTGEVSRISLDLELMSEFWNEFCNLVYLGDCHNASTVLKEQSAAVQVDSRKRDTLQSMADDVYLFWEHIIRRRYREAGYEMFINWEKKRSLCGIVSTLAIDSICRSVMLAGAYGVKLLGAGGAGCLLIICNPKDRQASVTAAIASASHSMSPQIIQASLTSRGVEKIL